MKRKRSFYFYECDYDALALYLEEMAGKGWHLKSCGQLSMVFEKGEPGKVRYEVAAPENLSLYDSTECEGNQTFRRLCEEAGWQFVCMKGRQCVFRTWDQEALHIDTDEVSRYRSVRKQMFGQGG